MPDKNPPDQPQSSPAPLPPPPAEPTITVDDWYTFAWRDLPFEAGQVFKSNNMGRQCTHAVWQRAFEDFMNAPALGVPPKT